MDVGNSTVDWLLSSTEGGERHGKAQDFAMLLKQLPARAVIHRVDLACVRRRKLAEWQEASASQWNLVPRVAKVQADYMRLRLVYADPSLLGVDRWLALLAVHDRAEPTWLIIDAGSALSLDLLDKGEHLGGFIVPGMKALRQASYAQIDGLTQQEESGAVYGTDTSSCISLGAQRMTRAFVYKELKKFCAAYPAGRIVFTGGNGEALHKEFSLLPATENRIHYDPCLVCRGLMLL